MGIKDLRDHATGQRDFIVDHLLIGGPAFHSKVSNQLALLLFFCRLHLFSPPSQPRSQQKIVCYLSTEL